jgi:hypothetical protein
MPRFLVARPADRARAADRCHGGCLAWPEDRDHRARFGVAGHDEQVNSWCSLYMRRLIVPRLLDGILDVFACCSLHGNSDYSSVNSAGLICYWRITCSQFNWSALITLFSAVWNCSPLCRSGRSLLSLTMAHEPGARSSLSRPMSSSSGFNPYTSSS